MIVCPLSLIAKDKDCLLSLFVARHIRITGFEELGSCDDFSTHVFERRLKQARALRKKKKTESDDENDDDDWNRVGRSVYAGDRPILKDEDSDFSDSD